MSVMLISHDLGVIAEFAQSVIVMYAGRVVEEAPVAQLFRRPVHPYTVGLIAAVPKLDSDALRLTTIAGRIPSPQEIIPGCRFSPRWVRRPGPRSRSCQWPRIRRRRWPGPGR